MPLYEYLCDNCGERFEVMQKFADVILTSHDKCGGKVQRLLSVPALQFKGSGWYVNDYAKAGSKSGNANSDGPSSKTDGKTESKTDSKADSKNGGESGKSGSSSTPAATPSTSTAQETKSKQ
jgi:putative FmdB family regulatory protein